MRLILMRHANTENGYGKQDIQRVLTAQGKDEATQAATFLQSQNIDKVLVSFAKRTMQTLDIITKQVSIAEREVVTELYEGKEDTIINLIALQKSFNKCLLVIGHNPHIYNVIMSLSNNNSDAYEHLIIGSMPTARIVIIDFDEMNLWDNVLYKKGDIIEIFTPK